MAKITFIGAGSTVFTQNLLGDILNLPALADSTICLHDIDPVRLKTSEVVAHRVSQTLGAHPTIQATTDRKEALRGSHYVICSIQVGGYKPCTVTDFEIPKKYGLRQTIADTLGIGGIMRALRTAPVLIDIARDMEALCPGAIFLNYVNPMAMNCWAVSRAVGSVRTVGLCHSVQHTSEQLATDIDVPSKEINFVCAGINHVSFYLTFERRAGGQCEDLYPKIRQVIDEGRVPEWNRTRYELFKHFGYFCTESSEHFAEYSPWFIKAGQPELIEKFNVPLDEYPRRCIEQIEKWAKLEQELKDESVPLEVKPSVEYASQIINSMETGELSVINGNVPNTGLIENLPGGCCVEVPCVVDKNGVTPTRVGALPPQLAALMQTNVNVQSLTVEAILTGKKEHVYQAAMLDPHTGGELNMEQIVNLVDDLLEAHGDWIPLFR